METNKRTHVTIEDPVTKLDLFLESKNGITRKMFLKLVGRFGKPCNWNHSDLGWMFAWGGYYLVMKDGSETSMRVFTREKDNHGHSVRHFFQSEWLLRNTWKRIYLRPMNLKVSDAFKLAHEFRNKDGRVRLDRRARRYYRFTKVGDRSEAMTFPEFCRQLNGVFPQTESKEDKAVA